jgi:radical SAM protein with 4Fe4S-binding SPASM domain
LTNRGGVLNFGGKESETQKLKNEIKPCHYLAYSFALDWNGDVLLCVQDWAKKVKLGNIVGDNLLDVWMSSRMAKLRNNLIKGNRDSSPCRECDADGTLHGFNHVNAWVNSIQK